MPKPGYANFTITEGAAKKLKEFSERNGMSLASLVNAIAEKIDPNVDLTTLMRALELAPSLKISHIPKAKKNVFYVLAIGGENRIYDTESDVIAALKTLVSGKEKLNPRDVNIFKVKTGEKEEITPIPWSKIALELIISEVVH